MCKPGAGCCGGHISDISPGRALAGLGCLWAVSEAWAAIEATIEVALIAAVVAAVVVAPLLTVIIVRNARRPGLQFSQPAALLRTPLFQAQIESRNAWRARHGGTPVRVPAIPAPQARALPGSSPRQRPAVPARSPRVVWAEIIDAVPGRRHAIGGRDGRQ